MAVSCMRHASCHNYRNSSFIVDVAIRQIPRSTERILVIVNLLLKSYDSSDTVTDSCGALNKINTEI